jgi:hypothetical protein
MTTKADYTEEEWKGLVRAPILAGGYVVVADMSLIGASSEAKGLFEAITGRPVPEAASDLIGAVVADIRADDPTDMPDLKNNRTAGPQMLNQLELDLEVLDRKSTPSEKAAFKAWIADLAQATAEAAREGGFLGIGGVQVSEKEHDALIRLRVLLGTPDPMA